MICGDLKGCTINNNLRQYHPLCLMQSELGYSSVCKELGIPLAYKGPFSIYYSGVLFSQAGHIPELLLDVLMGGSQGLSRKACFISSLFPVLNNEECLFYLFARIFHGTSELSLVYESGLV